MKLYFSLATLAITGRVMVDAGCADECTMAAAEVWKCGKTIYHCGSSDVICENTIKKGDNVKALDDAQCNDFKTMEFDGDFKKDWKCPSGDETEKGLSHYSCVTSEKNVCKIDAETTNGDLCSNTNVEDPDIVSFTTPDPHELPGYTTAPDATEAPEVVLDPNTGDSCEPGGYLVGSWKCGLNVYYCPDVVDALLGEQFNADVDLIAISEPCGAGTKWQSLKLNHDCFPQNGEQAKELSNYAWYDKDGKPLSKVDTPGACEPTKVPPVLLSEPDPTPAPEIETLVAPTEAPVAPTEAPVAPTEAPVAPTEAPVAPTEAPVAPTEAPVTVAVLQVPEPEPTCPMDYVEVGASGDAELCDGAPMVTLEGSNLVDASPYSGGADIIYGIVPSEDGKSVTLKVNNPFDSNADVFVKHDTASYLDGFPIPACDGFQDQPPCLDVASVADSSIDIVCHSSGYATVYTYFRVEGADTTGEPITIHECCYPEDVNSFTEATTDPTVVELAFRVQCECPDTTMAGRRLRGSS